MKKVFAALLLTLVLLGLSAPAMASTGTIHIVQRGQTLEGIARWYGVDLWTLARANGIVNPNRIYVGQRLVIPTGYSAPVGATYIVKPGDTLYSIARRYGVSVWAIAQANGIYNLQLIYVGQRLVIPGSAPAPPPAPVPTAKPPAPTTGWRGEYYVGTTPSGGPTFVRTDSAINFRWGTGGPDARVGVDSFSVHWTRTILFKGGLYRFTARVDDGVRIWIDGQPILDAWRVQPETVYQVDVVLTPGNHTVAVDYFEDTGVATVQVGFTRLGDGAIVVPTPVPTVVPTSPTPAGAWYGEYFNNETLSGSPAATRHDGAIGDIFKQHAIALLDHVGHVAAGDLGGELGEVIVEAEGFTGDGYAGGLGIVEIDDGKGALVALGIAPPEMADLPVLAEGRGAKGRKHGNRAGGGAGPGHKGSAVQSAHGCPPC